MQIKLSKNPSALYGANQERLPSNSARTAQETPRPSPTDKALTVAISPEAQTLQKEAAAKKTASARESDEKQVQAQQTLQSQRPAGNRRQRIDIAV